VNDTQKRIIAVLASVVALVFVAAGVLALARPSPSTTTLHAGPTTTPTSAPTTTTTESTTTTAEPVTSTTTTTTSPSDVLILGPENIDGIQFGTDAESAIASLTDVLGDPAADTGWVPPVDRQGVQIYGACPGSVVRLVEWPNLTTVYTDGLTAWAPEGTRHLFFYSYVMYDYDVYGLKTAEGIGLDSTADDLRAAYGDTVEIGTDQFGDYYRVDVPAPGALWGFLDAPDGHVVSIQGGEGCGE
jgi:hypothetical protein